MEAPVMEAPVKPMEGPVKYMLLICRDEPVWDKLSVAERQRIYADTVKIQEELTARGQYLGGHPLYPSSSATSVRVRDGKRLVTDGPFAETREQLGGYMLIDVKDLDEAIGIAARLPLARTSTVEVRPVREGAPTT
jgi:hypothetical protein